MAVRKHALCVFKAHARYCRRVSVRTGATVKCSSARRLATEHSLQTTTLASTLPSPDCVYRQNKPCRIKLLTPSCSFKLTQTVERRMRRFCAIRNLCPCWNRMPLTPRRLECAEISASNERTASLFALPGLVVWVHSVPAGIGDAGGDVHFVSVCPSCIVSRIALADVSGHGLAVKALGEKLQELMQRYLRAVEQVELMRDLNQAVRQEFDDVHYATMVAVGWHGRRGVLVVTNAGHPPPLWHRAAHDEWHWLGAQRASERVRPADVPLGLLADMNYDRTLVKPEVDDLVVLYTDGVSEATNPAGEQLGRDGLMDIAREVESSSAEGFGMALTSALRDFRGGVEPTDDETIIVLQAVAIDRRQTLK